VGFGSRFSDAQLGVTPDAIPSGDLLKAYELEYTLLRRIIAADTPPAKAAAPATAPRPQTTEPAGGGQ
jgi:hypothetical protein